MRLSQERLDCGISASGMEKIIFMLIYEENVNHYTCFEVRSENG